MLLLRPKVSHRGHTTGKIKGNGRTTEVGTIEAEAAGRSKGQHIQITG
jgi:hypothetical protein